MSIYYIEVNLICIIILLLFRLQLRNMNTSSSDQRILIAMIWATVLFCTSDMIAGIFRGMVFPGARAIIESSNLMYFEAIAIVSFLWTIYVHIRTSRTPIDNHRFFFFWSIPLILFTVIALLNPFTHFLFRISAENLYERNVGVYLHWVVVWGYFLVTSIITLQRYLQEKSRLKRQEIAPLLYFMVAPFIASMIQMCFYGVTSTQVGITISIVMICLTNQDTQILTDALTGINNRRGLEYYLANNMQRHVTSVYTLMMIDADHFKHINDKYGHMTGDLALQAIADALKQSCKVVSKRLHLCRFGGDEFMILGVACSETEIEKLRGAIAEEIVSKGVLYELPCEITVSIGVAAGTCLDEKEFKGLMNLADQAMYQEKMEKR